MAGTSVEGLFPERQVVDVASLAASQQAGCAERRQHLAEALSYRALAEDVRQMA